MDKLYWLEQIQAKTRKHKSTHSKLQTILGEQVLNLVKLIEAGYPVVPGFVLGADLWREFIEPLTGSETLVADLPDSSLHLDVDNWQQLQLVANRLCTEVVNAVVPNVWIEEILEAAQQWHNRCLILRPMLVLPEKVKQCAAIAKLFNGDGCVCERDAIARTLKRVWSQLFRATSLLYWQRMGIDLSQVGIAVLVQPLGDVVSSGILTVNPQRWEVQSTWGLGSTIERGDVIPDVDKVHPQQGRVVERKLGQKTVADWVLINPDTQNRLETQIITPLTDDSCIATCILNETQQQQFALAQPDLEQLIAIAQRLSHDFKQTFGLEWRIVATESGQSLWLTNLTTPDGDQQIDNYHLQGLAAASGRATGKAHVIANPEHQPKFVPPGSVLVAPSIAAEWLPLLSHSVGIITEEGGLTSHAAILARELCIPAVVRVRNATERIHTGDNLLIDGDKGEVFSDRDIDFNDTQVNRWENPQTENLEANHDDLQIPHGGNSRHDDLETNKDNFLSPPSLVPIATKLFVNLSQTQSLETIQVDAIDGVGLLRSELMAIPLLEGRNLEEWLNNHRHKHQLTERWSACISKFTRALAPRPVFYRTYDGRYLHKQVRSSSSSSRKTAPADSPIDHGTLNYIYHPELLDFELNALAKVLETGQTNLNLILPFVRTVEEFIYCRDRVIAAGLTNNREFQLWIMAEVPSVLFLLPDYIRAGVQGIAIGTNDLTRLLFATDRDKSLSSPTDARHPAVMKAVQQLIMTAKSGGIPCSICGYAPSQYPEIIDDLVRWGITAISVEPGAVRKSYHAIARAEQRLILEAARQNLAKGEKNNADQA